MTGEKKLKFEEALQRLEEVLARLEQNDCPLDEALELFQEGMRLVTFGRRKLAEAEGKISLLLGESGETAPFEEDEPY